MQLNRLHFLRHPSPIIFGDLIILKLAAGISVVGGGAEGSMFFSIHSFKAGGIWGFVWFLVFCFVLYGGLVDSPIILAFVFMDFYFLGFRSLETFVLMMAGGLVMFYFCCSYLFLRSFCSRQLTRYCITCIYVSTNKILLVVTSNTTLEG